MFAALVFFFLDHHCFRFFIHTHNKSGDIRLPREPVRASSNESVSDADRHHHAANI